MIFNVLHFFSGVGGFDRGMRDARVTIGSDEARFVTIGAIDHDPMAVENYPKVNDGDAATLADLYTREGYIAHHGEEPPADWREMSPADLLAITDGRRPHVVAASPPCQGYSALLPGQRVAEAKYQAKNDLILRWLFLVFETWPDDPPELLIMENVPKIASRGAAHLDLIRRVFESYGYKVSMERHNCGELGGLSQNRHRYLVVARRAATVPTLLYKPPVRRVGAIKEVIGELPPPNDPRGGRMHRLPRIKLKTWIKLACIPAGSDWKALNDWEEGRWFLEPVAPGVWSFVDRGAPGALPVGDVRERPRHSGVLGVRCMDQPSCTITGGALPNNGAFSIGDTRFGRVAHNNVLNVMSIEAASKTVTTGGTPTSGGLSIADPGLGCSPSGRSFRIQSVDKPCATVVARCELWQSAPMAIADPAPGGTAFDCGYRVDGWEAPARTVTCARVGSGAVLVSDPRMMCAPRNGTMGVQRWCDAAKTVIATMDVQNSPAAVGDPRIACGSSTDHWPTLEECDPPILLRDGCWNRPLTALELAALQGFSVFDAEGRPLEFTGGAKVWRRLIGNAVPPPTARAIGEQMLKTLIHAKRGRTFVLGLGDEDIWVKEARP